MNRTKHIFLLALVFALSLTGCKKWDDHVAVTEQDLTINLLDAIGANPSLSTFRQLITKAGMEGTLQATKTYTVWAPTNDALASLDPAISSDTAKLRQFIQNHISNQSFFTREVATVVRVPMLNGKYNQFTSSTFDDAGITAADKYVSNGVLHVINKFVPVRQNLWEFITGSTTTYAQNSFISSLNYNAFDPSLAIIDSISAITGLPVYHPGTGIVVRNSFTDKVYNVKDEQKLFTYFVMADPGFVTEADSLKPYFATGNTATTDSLTRWNVVKDMVVEGMYAASALPATLVSRSGVTIPINQANILQSFKVSNGIVHVMSKVDIVTVNKFRSYQIEGENPSGFFSDKRSNTNYRVRLNPVTGQTYMDILVSGHGVTSYYAYYRLNELPSMKYKVYGLAVNDFQTTAVTQNIVAKYYTSPTTTTTLATLAYAVPLKSATGAFTEVYLGEFISTSFGTVDIQLTSSGTNPIVLDYLRIVPQP